MIDNTPNQTSKFRTKNRVEINGDSCGIHNTNSQIKFKTTMLKSSLYYYSDAYILVKGTITLTGERERPDSAAIQADRNKQIIFTKYAPFRLLTV